MKVLVLAVVLVLMGDLTLNHGDTTAALLRGAGGFFEWLSHTGDNSVLLH